MRAARHRPRVHTPYDQARGNHKEGSKMLTIFLRWSETNEGSCAELCRQTLNLQHRHAGGNIYRSIIYPIVTPAAMFEAEARRFSNRLHSKMPQIENWSMYVLSRRAFPLSAESMSPIYVPAGANSSGVVPSSSRHFLAGFAPLTGAPFPGSNTEIKHRLHHTQHPHFLT